MGAEGCPLNSFPFALVAFPLLELVCVLRDTTSGGGDGRTEALPPLKTHLLDYFPRGVHPTRCGRKQVAAGAERAERPAGEGAQRAALPLAGLGRARGRPACNKLLQTFHVNFSLVNIHCRTEMTNGFSLMIG